MKRLFTIILALFVLSIALPAHANGEGLQRGEYKLLAYTLSDGNSSPYSNSSSSKSISFHSLYISSETMNTVLNREDYSLSNPYININEKTITRGLPLGWPMLQHPISLFTVPSA